VKAEDLDITLQDRCVDRNGGSAPKRSKMAASRRSIEVDYGRVSHTVGLPHVGSANGRRCRRQLENGVLLGNPKAEAVKPRKSP